VHFLDRAADVVADEFCQRLILHRRIRFGAQRVAELPLDQSEREFTFESGRRTQLN